MRILLIIGLLIPGWVPAQGYRIQSPHPREALVESGITTVETWFIQRASGKRELASVITLNGKNDRTTEKTFIDFRHDTTFRVRNEYRSDDKTVFTYTYVQRLPGTGMKLFEKQAVYFNAERQVVKRYSENHFGVDQYLTVYIDPGHPDYRNSMLYKLRGDADTFQVISNYQDDTIHVYKLLSRENDKWKEDEKSITHFRDGVFYDFTQYRNGELLNHYTAEEKRRQQEEMNRNADKELSIEYGLPYHQHDPPSDTVYCADVSFADGKWMKKKKRGKPAYKRIRIYDNPDQPKIIEEWIYDPRGRVIRKDMRYEEYYTEYIYK